MAAPASLAPARRVGLTAGVLLALGYGEATLGPLALGGLRDTFGSYTIGWLLVLGLSVVLAATALGIPGRAGQQTRAPETSLADVRDDLSRREDHGGARV
jgi:cyanate permease